MDNWTTLDWARYYYFERGWHILPALKGTKKCYLTWKKDGYENKRYDWDFLEKEFSKPDVTNIILVNGLSGTTSIDYDPRNLIKDDPAEVDFINALLDQIPDTLETVTGSGGSHWICQSTHDHKKEHKISTCIDIKSNELLVLPPSIHESGNRYKFKNNEYDKPLAPYPYEVLSQYYKHSDLPEVDYEQKDWSKIFEKNPKGKRNDITCSVLGKLLTSLPESDWEAVGWELAKAYDLQFNDPPLSVEYGVDDLRKKWEYFKADRLSKKPVREAPDIPYILSMEDAYNIKLPPQEWLIHDVLPKGITVAFGNPSHGKSFLAYAIVKALVTGTNFLGHESKKAKVLFVGKDNGFEGDIARFKDLKLPKDASLSFYTQESNFLVDNKEEKDKLFELVREHKFELIVWDTFRDIFLGEESSSSVVNQVIQYWKSFLGLPVPCSSLATHHIKKDTTNPVKDLAALARGSTALWGAATAMYLVHKAVPDKDVISVYPAKMKRRKMIDPFAFELVGTPITVEDFKLVNPPEAYQQGHNKSQDKKDLFKSAIDNLLTGTTGLSKQQIQRYCTETLKMSTATYFRRFADCLESGYIEEWSENGDWLVKLKGGY